MITLSLVSAQIGFRVRGHLDQQVIDKLYEVVTLCKAHLDSEKTSDELKQFQTPRSQKPHIIET